MSGNGKYLRSLTIESQLKLIEESKTYSYKKNVDNNSEYFELIGCDFSNGSWLTYGNAGSWIKMYVKAGAVIKFTRSPYDNANKVSINNQEQSAAKGESIEYKVTEDGYVIITADNTAYLSSISVSFDKVSQDKVFQAGDSVNFFSDGNTGVNVASGETGTFDSVTITAPNGFTYGNNGNPYMTTNAGTVFTFKVADGVTAENTSILLVEYLGDETKYNSYFTYSVDTTTNTVTVTVGSSTLYIKAIKLVAKA